MGRYFWQCSLCDAMYTPSAIVYTCPQCGDVGVLTMVPDYAAIGSGRLPQHSLHIHEYSMWRYACLLPLEEVNLQDAPVFSALSVGWTPLYQARWLSKALGLSSVYIKDEGRNPTGSLKDRASALVVAKALELGKTTVATASSGNAAAALAGFCAANNIDCVVFVPEHTPKAKITQLQIYDAQIYLVRDNYDSTVRLSSSACNTLGWYCRNTAYNPHTTEGKKTVALEIAEQLGWKAPDTVLVPVGDGNILVGVYRGFLDALHMGWIQRLPRIIGVQSEKAPALYEAWRSGKDQIERKPAQTLADSINVAYPQDGFRALHAVRQTNGCFLTVPDDAIIDAMAFLARTTGIFVEPSSATTVAALPLLKERGVISPEETIVLVSTGNGLKDPEQVQRYCDPPRRIDPTLASLLEAV